MRDLIGEEMAHEASELLRGRLAHTLPHLVDETFARAQHLKARARGHEGAVAAWARVLVRLTSSRYPVDMRHSRPRRLQRGGVRG